MGSFTQHKSELLKKNKVEVSIESVSCLPIEELHDQRKNYSSMTYALAHKKPGFSPNLWLQQNISVKTRFLDPQLIRLNLCVQNLRNAIARFLQMSLRISIRILVQIANTLAQTLPQLPQLVPRQSARILRCTGFSQHHSD
jgi:hypothetical protein